MDKMKIANICEIVGVFCVALSVLIFLQTMFSHKIDSYIIGEIFLSTGFLILYFCRSYVLHLYKVKYGELDE